MSTDIREPAVAGRFYTGDRDELNDFLDDAINPGLGEEGIRAVISPHAGYVYSGSTAGATFSKVKPGSFTRAVVLAPAHRVALRGLSIAPYGSYATPLGQLEVDQAAARRLLHDPIFCQHDNAHTGEHSLEVQLPFIQRLNPGSTLLPILVGDVTAEQISRAADSLAREWTPETLVVVSTDFTHYGNSFGYTPFHRSVAKEELKKLDGGAIERILARDNAGFMEYVEQTGATICGRKPISILLAMLDAPKGLGPDAELELVEYTTSGDVSGNFDSSVSYAGIIVRQLLPASDRRLLRQIARDAIHAHLMNEIYEPSEQLHRPGRSILRENRASFVTLRINGELRGCIGSLEGREPLLVNVAHNAINAAFNDSRFPPVTEEEYKDLEYHISVLTPPKPIPSPDDIILGKHGIILKRGPCRAVYLPSVATDQGWDLKETLQHLSAKAGLPRDEWRKAKFEVFETISV